jgi:hypothetical protein
MHTLSHHVETDDSAGKKQQQRESQGAERCACARRRTSAAAAQKTNAVDRASHSSNCRPGVSEIRFDRRRLSTLTYLTQPAVPAVYDHHAHVPRKFQRQRTRRRGAARVRWHCKASHCSARASQRAHSAPRASNACRTRAAGAAGSQSQPQPAPGTAQRGMERRPHAPENGKPALERTACRRLWSIHAVHAGFRGCIDPQAPPEQHAPGTLSGLGLAQRTHSPSGAERGGIAARQAHAVSG